MSSTLIFVRWLRCMTHTSHLQPLIELYTHGIWHWVGMNFREVISLCKETTKNWFLKQLRLLDWEFFFFFFWKNCKCQKLYQCFFLMGRGLLLLLLAACFCWFTGTGTQPKALSYNETVSYLLWEMGYKLNGCNWST